MITAKKIKKKAKEFSKYKEDLRFYTQGNRKVYYLDLPRHTKVRTYLNLIVRLNQTAQGDCDIVIKSDFKKWFLLVKWFQKISNLYFSHPLRQIPNKIKVSPKKGADIRVDFNYKKVYEQKGLVTNVIPYIMHPSRYFPTQKEYGAIEKYGGIVASGNFSQELYGFPFVKDSFDMENRWELYKVLVTLPNVKAFGGREYMKVYKEGAYKNSFLLMEWQKSAIPSDQWMEYLATFKFIFCAPGVIMPMCHNILEAMSVGVVPITNYASWLNPSLDDGVNCVTYTTTETLEAVINKCLSMPDSEYLLLQKEVRDYYNAYYKTYSIEPGEYSMLNEDKIDLV